MARYNHNWPVIKAEYVEGEKNADGKRILPSLEELAQKYKIHAVTVRKKAARDGWLQERYSFTTKVETVRQEKKVEEISEERVKFDGDCVKVARALLAHCARDLDPKTTLSPSEKAALSQAIKNAQQIGNIGFGDKPTTPPGVQINNLITGDLTILTEAEIATAVSLGIKIAPVTPHDS